MARIPFLLWLTLLLAAPLRAHGHDLAVDQLTLWPEPAGVRGQLLFDPQLTRPRAAPADAAARARVLAFVRSNLRLEVDGRSAELALEVRELWTGDGAIAGDSVMLRAALPSLPRELRVFVGAPFRGLAVSVEVPNAVGSLVPRSTLVTGGSWSPPYRFELGALGAEWQLGGPGELRLGELRHGVEPGLAGGPARAPASDPGLEARAPEKVGLLELVLGAAALIAAGALAWVVSRRFHAH